MAHGICFHVEVIVSSNIPSAFEASRCKDHCPASVLGEVKPALVPQFADAPPAIVTNNNTEYNNNDNDNDNDVIPLTRRGWIWIKNVELCVWFHSARPIEV
ncbi:hypothetical protein I7I50_08098 [Histoplasma capsulatum G186AR]|uniref:Uncharacterized protein n=1 Tax=Ajellomyces capsulatus TaxID=5037 RepID=A0A8H7YHG3_AJECA|nr:hypothetical protein I7I52_08614 [Histoplasma capsulatum]QSS68624.1 hypothetical protein I7I50_08098 [Histoplasma capsulatum G186AR]